MKILLIGEVFSDNLGDRLICEETKRVLLSIYPDATFGEMDIMNRVLKEKEFQENVCNSRLGELKVFLLKNRCVRMLYEKRNIRRLRSVYEEKISSEYNFAVFTGGALLQSGFVQYLKCIVRLLEKYQINAVFNAVGTGILSVYDRKILKRILNSSVIRGISCRCREERINRFLVGNKKVIKTFDTAIFSSLRLNQEVKKEGYLGLGIMKSTRFTEKCLIDFWNEVIKECERREIKWRLFTTGQPNDQELAEKVLDFYDGEKSDKLLMRPLLTSELVENISSFNAILSFRLHSHIIAYSVGVPSVGISWDNKIEDFFGSIDLLSHVKKMDEVKVFDLVGLAKDVMERKELSPVDVEGAQKLSKDVLERMLKTI